MSQPPLCKKSFWWVFLIWSILICNSDKGEWQQMVKLIMLPLVVLLYSGLSHDWIWLDKCAMNIMHTVIHWFKEYRQVSIDNDELYILLMLFVVCGEISWTSWHTILWFQWFTQYSLEGAALWSRGRAELPIGWVGCSLGPHPWRGPIFEKKIKINFKKSRRL